MKEQGRDRIKPAPQVSPTYLVILVCTGLAAVCLYYVVLLGLQAGRNLPAPAFSNSVCVDEKLRFLRSDRPAAQPNLLVVGSSVAWRQFDGDAVRAVAPGVIPLNGAFCGLSAHETQYTAKWLLDRNPTVRDVVMIASPLDFEDCSSKPAAIFNRRDADNYVYNSASIWPYYVTYFDPVSLARNAINIRNKRLGLAKVDPLMFDRYGAGPLVSGDWRGLLYGPVNRLDPACFKAAAALSQDLHAQGRRLMLVATPLYPQWKALGDTRRAAGQFESGLKAIPYAEFWSADAAGVAQPKDFFDAVHIRWSAARGFSEALARHFRLDAAPARAPPQG